MSSPESGSAAPASGSGASAPSSASTPTGATSSSAGEQSAAQSSATPAAQSTQATQASSEPPRERWDDILKNARAKTRSEVEAEYRNRYGKYDQFEQDPWGAVQGWLDQASQHSLYGPLVQQWFQSRQAPSQPQIGEEPKADIPVVDAQGQITGYTYSDKRLKEWHKWSQAQQQQAYDQRLGPLEQFAQRQIEQQQAQQVWHQATQQAGQTLGILREQPYFKEHEAAIKQALLEHEEWGDNVHAAYNHVLVTKILPTLSQAEQQKVVDSINQKAAGGTVSPRGTTAGTPQFKSFAQAARYYAEHPEEANAMANRR